MRLEGLNSAEYWINSYHRLNILFVHVRRNIIIVLMENLLYNYNSHFSVINFHSTQYLKIISAKLIQYTSMVTCVMSDNKSLD